MPKDDFWNIENISVRRVEPLRKAEPLGSAPAVPTRPASEKPAAMPAKPASEAPEALTMLRYAPENTLLDEVKIGRWPSHYSFYEQFLGYARNYFDFCPGESEYLPFFSFMPQYQQMTRKQLCYYGWWRENLREGRYLRTDYCYILLYIYEVLNLPELLPPERGVRELALLWANYREEFPRLDKYLAEWLCDYCLIHRQPCPRDILAPFLQKILPNTTLREFYLPAAGGDAESSAAALVELNASYQFRLSKYRTEETRELFEKHIPAAMTAFLTEMGARDPRFLLSRGSEPIIVSRDSYVGAVCAFRNKRQITVTYRPVVASGGLSPIITDAVKSCENGVRAALGIRARFRVTHLSAGMQTIIDRYFALHLPPLSPKNAPVVLPDGSVLPEVDESAYEKPREALSAEAARQIEFSSRSTAELLGEEENDELTLAPAPVEMPTPEKVADATERELTLRALRFLLLGDEEGLRALAESQTLLPDTLVGRLNDEALTRLGDVIAEQPDGAHWQLIEDYREDLTQWIKELEISTTNETN